MKKILKRLKKFHADDQGADLIEYVLIMAAIALPVLILVIYYKGEISDWLGESWEDVRNQDDGTGN